MLTLACFADRVLGAGIVDNFVDKWISLWKICYSWGFNLLLRALVSMSRLYQAQFRLEIVLSL